MLQLGYDALEPQTIRELFREQGGHVPRLRSHAYRVRKLGFRDREALDRLWERVRHSYPFACVRDFRRLRTRYLARPDGSYHVFGVSPRFSRDLVAWVVFSMVEGHCCWVDLLWDHQHPGALELLVRLSHRLSVQLGGTREKIWIHGDGETEGRLVEQGFLARQRSLPLVFVARAFRSDIDLRNLDGRVYLTMGDTDLY